MQIIEQYSVNGDLRWGGVAGGGVRAPSLEASQWAGRSVFKGNVVCLTGAPRGRHAAVGLIRKKKKKIQMRRR